VEQPPERPLKWWDKVDEELANPQTSASAVPIWLAVMTVITALFFGARSYYWSEPAVDEDGIFAKIIMDHTKGPHISFLLESHIEILHLYSHPGIIYEVLKTPGFILNMNRHKGDPIDQRTVVSMLSPCRCSSTRSFSCCCGR